MGEMDDAYLGWFETQPVTVTFKRSGEANATVEVAIAKRHALTAKEAMIIGVNLTGDETVWNIPVTLLEADVNYPGSIRRADTITEADANGGEVWVVGFVSLKSYKSRYYLVCNKSRVSV